MTILNKLKEQQAKEQELRWEGTFGDYLALLKDKPFIAKPAHSRIYDMIQSFGQENGRYLFFSKSLFGMEETIQRLVDEYFHPAAKKLDVKKRILLLMGPVGGGKSTIVSLLKKGLEQYTKTEAGAVYAIKGCPMAEDPLHLIPAELRQDFYEEYGIQIEGTLSPLNAHRLTHEFSGRIEDVPVERIFFSEDRRRGIGTFSPSDPKSQDIADLTGSIDFSTIAEFGSESDPRAYRFDGELNIANRGLMEFQEILKCDEKFLWHLLSLTQEGNFKAGRFALISADEMIIAHTNEWEYRSFIADKKNEALHSRMIVIPVPYSLRVSEEEKIYEKMIRESESATVHFAPHTFRTAAMFTVLTRLKPSKRSGVSLVTKMKLYDGMDVDGLSEHDAVQLRGEYPDEGMDGIDPRYVMNRISAAIIKKGTNSIHALDVLKSLKDGLAHHPSISAEQKERYEQLIMEARKQYDDIAKKEVQRAFVYAYDESARALMNNYVDHIEAFCRKITVTDPLTGEHIPADERLMRSIEEQIGVSENAKKAFREEMLIRLSAYARKGKAFDYTEHAQLQEAIQKKLFADLKDVVRLTTAAVAPDEEQLKKRQDVINRLVEECGYTTDSAAELIRYVGGLLNRT